MKITPENLDLLGAERAGAGWLLAGQVEFFCAQGQWYVCHRGGKGSTRVDTVAEALNIMWFQGRVHGAEGYREQVRALLRDLLGLEGS